MKNYEIENELIPNLSPGEKLIWTGRPQTGLKLRSSDAFLIPFSLLWGGFAVFWESSVIVTDAPFFFKLWGIPFVLVGIYMIIGRFFVDAKKRANTIYGLTQDRIIIKSGIFSQDVQSLNIKIISEITFNQKLDNTGTITLGPTPVRQGRGSVNQPPQLEFIKDVKSVYDKIIEIQRQK